MSRNILCNLGISTSPHQKQLLILMSKVYILQEGAGQATKLLMSCMRISASVQGFILSIARQSNVAEVLKLSL